MEFASHPRVRFVRHKSGPYFETLESSHYLVNNATFPAEFIKRPEQIYVNVWHGTPLKKMGYDIDRGADGARNVMRNFMSADYLVSQNQFMTERMYLGAYKLGNVYRGAIIEEGYPRTDLMFKEGAGDRARKVLRSQGVETEGKKVLVYAPTWRGESFYNPQSDGSRLKETLRQLQEAISAEGWVVLLKAHQVVVDQLIHDDDLASFLIPNDVPSNEVLGLTDALITDYSSIFVDYLATRKPLFFHLPDASNYSSERGLYLESDELPGPISQSIDELVSHVVTLTTDPGYASVFPGEAARIAEMASGLTPRDDGAATKRINDIVFNGKEEGHSVRRGFDDGRKRIAIYLGGMITNGITSSALNLLNSIDDTVYDVTAFFYRSRQRDRVENAEMIPSHVRQVIRDPGILQLPLLGSMHELDETSLEDMPASDEDSILWKWEWRRLFGQSEFDAAVDFSGYSSYWTRIMAHASAPKRAIWLHNDLEADAEREVNGVRPHFQNLTGVFKLYRDFDALVSVSPDLDKINQQSLAAYAPIKKFCSARNTINVERVRAGGGRSKAHRADAGSMVLDNLANAVQTLAGLYTYDELIAEASRQQLVTNFIGENRGRTFVTVGRLSPEKNHARLIDAFAQIVKEEPTAKLVIIGEGPLEGQLKEQAVSLGIVSSVEFTGRLRNPYAVMSACDCFVMSSDYEGQPIVILEARVLGLPIVTTRFGSAESAMENSGGIIVECNASALAGGMREFLQGEITPEPFDGDVYNAEVMREFEQAVFGEVARPTLAHGM